MPDINHAALDVGEQDFCQSVCIHTKKIYDSCREEDISLLRI